MSHQDSSALAAELESLLSTKKGAKLTVPSTQHLFRIGGILYRFHQADVAADPRTSAPEVKKLLSTCRKLIASLATSILANYFVTYKLVLKKLSQQSVRGGDNSNKDPYDTYSEAIESILGLVSHSYRLCTIACTKDFLVELVRLYDQYHAHFESLTRKGDEVPTRQRRSKDDILKIVSFMLLDGPLSMNKPKGKSDSKTESMEKFMQLIQSIEDASTEFLGDMQEWQVTHETKRRTLEGAIQSYFRPSQGAADQTSVSDQLDYLLSMLDTARQAHAERQKSIAATASPDNTQKEEKSSSSGKMISAADELERRILQVQHILPDLGQGFIEAALSLFQGNVETTVATLLSDSSEYPPSLQMIDRTLPRRRKERSAEETEASREARELVKERMAVEQKQQEERYKSFLYVAKQAQDEYNDDYDDQYDDMDDGGLGGADSGWSDMEHVKAYNQVAREEEAEKAFWEESKNLNKAGKGAQQSSKEKGAESTEKQYRGPDKIKGGRVIGPDGKAVKRPGRGRKTPNANTNNTPQQNQKQNPGQSSKNGSKDDAAKAQNGQKSDQPGTDQANAKRRTKPKSENRINQRRDRKQKAQGTFGA